MKSLYRKQFSMMAAMVLVAILLLGCAFIAISYQYIVRERSEAQARNTEYIAAFTANYISTQRTSVSDPAYQLYIASLAEVSGSTVLLAENTGEIVYASAPDRESTRDLLGKQVSAVWLDEVSQNGGGSWRSGMNGLVAENSFVTARPVLQSNHITGTTYQRGVVLVVSDGSSLVSMWQDLAGIFLLTAIAVLLLAAVVSSVTSMQQTRPLKEMAETARKFGRGEMDARVVGCEGRRDEVGELAEAFNAMADSLAQAEQERSEFISNVSHELKTPMTTIAGFADGILDGTIPPDKETEALQTISSETRRLSRLVRRMLDLGRLQSKENVTAQEKFDVSELLLRVLVSLEGKITDRGLDVETDLPETPVHAWGDPDGITQVCYNLLDNAIKFAAPGTALGLAVKVKGEKAYVSVRDTGAVIPPEEQNQIFDRFHKSDKSRSMDRDGVGLGLYIVKTILNNHRENITVKSEDGVTEFTFTLTLA